MSVTELTNGVIKKADKCCLFSFGLNSCVSLLQDFGYGKNILKRDQITLTLLLLVPLQMELYV